MCVCAVILLCESVTVGLSESADAGRVGWWECVYLGTAGLARREPGQDAHVLAARVLWLTAPRYPPRRPCLVGQRAQPRPVSVCQLGLPLFQTGPHPWHRPRFHTGSSPTAGPLQARPAAPLPWDFHPQQKRSLPRTGGAVPGPDRRATSAAALAAPENSQNECLLPALCKRSQILRWGGWAPLSCHPLSEACPTSLFQTAAHPSLSPTCTLTPHTGPFSLSFLK